ncbi:MAG: T9SS type A sorting domain-containing protein [Bacteroidales bacterium]|nr:T9SS type A sorting domain-containing protein [Bacteroidales bacterium]
MKKFYMILAALLLGSVCFAQKAMPLSNNTLDTQINQARETGWYGSAGASSYWKREAGEYVILRPELYAGATTAGEQVTKIKFYNYQNASYAAYTSMSFTIKIYQGSGLDDAFISQGYANDNDALLGTLAYTQDFTATTYGEQIVDLTTPYTITSANYWVVLQCNGQSLLVGARGDQISTAVDYSAYQAQTAEPELTITDWSGAPYLIYENDSYLDIDAWYGLDYTTQPNVAFFYQLPCFQIYVQGSGAYVPTSNLEAMFLNTYPNPTNYAATTMTLQPTDNLTLYPAIQNNGPDAATQNITFAITVDGAEAFSYTYELSESDNLGNGYFMPINFSQTEGQYAPMQFTAEEMDQLGLSGTMNICLNVTYAGTDPDLSDNETCIAVTRVTASVEENVAEAVSVYPNPANDMFTVANAEGATIVVVNSLGQVVANIENAASNQTIDASSFANGTYFVKVNESVIKINVVK